MRPLGGLLAISMAVIGAATASAAEPSTAATSGGALLDAAFAAPQIAVRADPVAAMSAGGVFTSANNVRFNAADGQGLQVWRSREIRSARRSDGAVDTLRVSIAGLARGAGGVVLASPGGLLEPEAQAFDVTYTRGWPAALKLSTGGYDLDVSPHAGLGVSSAGGSAEAGALVRLGAHLEDRVISSLDGLGVHAVDRASFGGRGRWYLFAAASGRSVGLTMTRDAQGDLRRAGWSTDASSTLISDAQAGVGWRKGDMQASFGYVHREVRPMIVAPFGVGTSKVSDSMVAFSLSLRPR